MTDRQAIEEAGFEALQRLYAVAIGPTGQCRHVAGFLLSLYNGQRFPFDPTDLRALDAALFEDCMKVLCMDARITVREVHTYFENGGRKFEALAQAWGIEDMEKVREDARRAAQPEGAVAPLHDGGRFEARVVGYGEAPGYRDLTLQLRMGEKENTQVSVRLGASAGVDLMHHIACLHAFCWREDRRPLDASESERRPAWLDRAPALHAGYPAGSDAG